MNNHYLIAAILIAAIATFALRAFPFALIKLARRQKRLFAYLSAVMPPSIMAILSMYCIVSLRWASPAQTAVSLSALAVLIILEHRKRQPVLSICSALIVYVTGQSLIGATT